MVFGQQRALLYALLHTVHPSELVVTNNEESCWEPGLPPGAAQSSVWGTRQIAADPTAGSCSGLEPSQT